MDAALLSARLALAAVFAVAALAKLADRAGTRHTLTDFGVPTALVGPAGLRLPLAELAIAVALIPTVTAWWGAAGGLLLLAVFVAGIGANLARGRAPRCRCFGQVAAGPVGPATLLRNGLFAAAAGFVVWQGQPDAGPSAVGWLGELTVAERAGLAVASLALGLLGAVGWLLLQVLGQQGRLLLRLDEIERRLVAGGAFTATASSSERAPTPEGLPVGAVAPSFQLPDLDGDERTLAGLLAASRPLLLVFVDPECGPCAGLLPDVGRWQLVYAATLTVAVVSRGAPEANRSKAAEHGVEPVLLQRDYEVADLYGVFATPSAVLVRPDGTIGSPVAGGIEPIRSLLAHAVSGRAAETWTAPLPLPLANGSGQLAGHTPDSGQPDALTRLEPGDPVPAFALADLDGRPVSSADLHGRRTLVLFWSPSCGYCQQLLPEVTEWEAALASAGSGAATRLLLVSAGTVEENRALGLRSTVVVDEAFEIGESFGVDGTPSGILVDPDGTVASALAVGAPAMRELAAECLGCRDQEDGLGSGARSQPSAALGAS